MADPHPAPYPRLGRGRGGGIRVNSLTQISIAPIPNKSHFNKRTDSLKEFFFARKVKKSPRQKVTFNLNSLRNFPYQSHTQSSHSSQSKSIMPSPTVPETPAAPSTTMVSPSPNAWTTVPKRKSATPVLTQLTQHSIESTQDENVYAIFTDAEDDDVPTDSVPLASDDEFPSPFEFPSSTFRPKSSKKKNKKKQTKKLRKSKSRGTQSSDTSMDSDAEVQLKRYPKDKAASSKRVIFDDDSLPDNISDVPKTTLNAETPSPPAKSTDLVDSADDTQQPPKVSLTNADIRSFYTKSKPIEHPSSLTIPTRICVLIVNSALLPLILSLPVYFSHF